MGKTGKFKFVIFFTSWNCFNVF